MTSNDIAGHGATDRVEQWALVGLVVYVATWPIALLGVATVEQLLFGPLGWHAEAGTESLSIRNGTFPIVWGVLAAAASAAVARRWVPGARFRLAGWIALGAGLALAGVSEYETDEFVRRWAGLFDPEYAGLSLFIPEAIVATALAAWAALAVPRRRRAVPVAMAVVAAAGLGVALASNLPGAAGGIREANLAIAAVYGLDAAFAIGAVLLTVVDSGPEARRLRA